MIGTAPVGSLHDDLQVACLAALSISPQACVAFAAKHSWEASARAFVDRATHIRIDPEGDPVPFEIDQPRFVS